MRSPAASSTGAYSLTASGDAPANPLPDPAPEKTSLHPLFLIIAYIAGGVLQVIVVADCTVTFVALFVPNFTLTVPLVAKLEPVIVTSVPPACGPFVGLRLPIAGGGT